MGIKWFAAGLLWALAGAAGAVGQIADVTVYDRVENRVLPVYRHEGRYYVVGVPGHEYQVRVLNRTGADVLAVVSVDGVNAVSGETASWAQSGYVLGAHQSYDIRGWRKSLQRVAAFFFTRHENSYAARTGRPDHVGVIGVAMFRRKAAPAARIAPERRPWPQGRAGADSAAESEGSDDATASAPADQEAASGALRDRQAYRSERKLGTGHGRSESSHVTYTEFERASSSPDEVIAIHYDTYRNLVAQGVIRGPHAVVPSPFPGQFVPDPR